MCKDVGGRGQARNIQLHHRECGVQRAIEERALASVPGVVDQDIDRNASFAKPLMQLEDGSKIREIDALNHDIDAVLLPQCVGECVKAIQPARHQNERMAFRGRLAGELRAEAARGAGDEHP